MAEAGASGGHEESSKKSCYYRSSIADVIFQPIVKQVVENICSEVPMKIQDIGKNDPTDGVICFGVIHGRVDSCIKTARFGFEDQHVLWVILFDHEVNKSKKPLDVYNLSGHSCFGCDILYYNNDNLLNMNLKENTKVMQRIQTALKKKYGIGPSCLERLKEWYRSFQSQDETSIPKPSQLIKKHWMQIGKLDFEKKQKLQSEIIDFQPYDAQFGFKILLVDMRPDTDELPPRWIIDMFGKVLQDDSNQGPSAKENTTKLEFIPMTDESGKTSIPDNICVAVIVDATTMTESKLESSVLKKIEGLPRCVVLTNLEKFTDDTNSFESAFRSGKVHTIVDECSHMYGINPMQIYPLKKIREQRNELVYDCLVLFIYWNLLKMIDGHARDYCSRSNDDPDSHASTNENVNAQ